MLIQARNQDQKQNRSLLKDFDPVKKSRPKAAKPQFLKLKKDLRVLWHLTNRQKQFYLCLLSLTKGGLKPITRPVRLKAQRRLGIGWQAYFKMMEILKEKRFICYQKVLKDKKTSSLSLYRPLKYQKGLKDKKTRPFVYSGIINTKKFLLVPLKTESGASIFQKGFDLESYLNELEKADRHPKQAGLPELFAVAKRTKRHRAANMARKALIFQGRQKSKAHIESKDIYRTTETIPQKNQAPHEQNISLKPLFKENSYMKHKTIRFFDKRMANPCRRLWTKTKILIKNKRKMLASQTKLFLPKQPCLYRETSKQERIEVFAPVKIPPREKPWSWQKSAIYGAEGSLATLRLLWKMARSPQEKQQLELRAIDVKSRITRIKQSMV